LCGNAVFRHKNYSGGQGSPDHTMAIVLWCMRRQVRQGAVPCGCVIPQKACRISDEDVSSGQCHGHIPSAAVRQCAWRQAVVCVPLPKSPVRQQHCPEPRIPRGRTAVILLSPG